MNTLPRKPLAVVHVGHLPSVALAAAQSVQAARAATHTPLAVGRAGRSLCAPLMHAVLAVRAGRARRRTGRSRHQHKLRAGDCSSPALLVCAWSLGSAALGGLPSPVSPALLVLHEEEEMVDTRKKMGFRERKKETKLLCQESALCEIVSGLLSIWLLCKPRVFLMIQLIYMGSCSPFNTGTFKAANKIGISILPMQESFSKN